MSSSLRKATARIRDGKKRGRSDEIREVNEKLHSAARRRDVEQVRTLMRDGIERCVVDGRSYAIAVNACAEVGDAAGALEWLWAAASCRKEGLAPGVAACTAALKAACSRRKVWLGKLLLEAMATENGVDRLWKACGFRTMPRLGPRCRPNVRTANTFLRGCLRAGAVEETSWCLAKMKEEWHIEPDESSRTYAATILSYALRPREAARCVLSLDDPQAYLSIARAYAVVGQGKACVDAARTGLRGLDDDRTSQRTRVGNSKDEGGKRSSRAIEASRSASDTVFRSHRAVEQRVALSALVEFGERLEKNCDTVPPDAVGALRRCLILDDDDDESGNDSGSCSSSTSTASDDAQVDALRRRLGLDEALRRAAERVWVDDSRSSRRRRSLLVRAGLAAIGAEFADAIIPGSSPRADCFVIDHRRWLRSRSAKVVLALELGAGDGEWAARRAATVPSSAWAWVACEYRHDRAAAIVARAALNGIHNLGVVRGDAAACLDTFDDSSLDKCFANFPEPPAQVGDDSDAGAYDGRHMLDSSLFRKLARVLAPRGTACVVTDNAWYAKLLLRVVQKSDPDNTIFETASPKEGNVFSSGSLGIYKGRLGPRVGHFDETSTTYFDRLWRTGVSQHAAKSDRFVLFLRRKVSSSSFRDARIATKVSEKRRAPRDDAERVAVAEKKKRKKRKNSERQSTPL